MTAWHTSLEHVDAVVLRRDNSLFAIAASDHKGEALDKAVESFAFID